MPMVQEVVPDLLKHELQLAILLPDSRTQQERLPSGVSNWYARLGTLIYTAMSAK